LETPDDLLLTSLADVLQGEVTEAEFARAVALVALDVPLGDERNAVLVLLRPRATAGHARCRYLIDVRATRRRTRSITTVPTGGE
jgi:hypothetical protein